MRGILIIIDGLADLPCKQLSGKTPLEAAEKPNLDYLTNKGELGYMYPVKQGVVPESDQAVLSILGNEVTGSYRGQFEALGSGVNIRKGDLALRANFASVENLMSKRIVDRRAGRTLTTKEASVLAEAINKISLPCKFVFKNTVQHRGVLVLKGGFSDNITDTDPEYHLQDKLVSFDKFKYSRALDEEQNTEYTANIVNEFIEKSFKVLNEHPINLERERKGLMKANIILTRGASSSLPKLRKFNGWASVVYMPVEKGICKASGMDVFSFSYPELKSLDLYSTLHKALKQACRFSIKILKKQKKNYDYFYIHFKETDIPGHDNKPQEKKAMIEEIDKNFFSFLKKFIGKNNIKILVTADHSTPCKLKSHSSNPVPVLLYDWQKTEEKQGKKIEFSERQATKGSLGKVYGKELLLKVGFVR